MVTESNGFSGDLDGISDEPLKLVLAQLLNKLIDARPLTQFEAGRIVGLPQSRMSQLRHYKLRNISVERLMVGLTAFGQNIEISLSPAEPETMGKVRVKVR